MLIFLQVDVIRVEDFKSDEAKVVGFALIDTISTNSTYYVNFKLFFSKSLQTSLKLKASTTN